MTNLDAIIENASLEIPERAVPNLPQRAGLWRVISLIAVAAALIVSIMAILQSRDASNVAVPDRNPVELESTTVTVADLANPGSASVSVLGLDESDTRRDFVTSGTQVDIPVGITALVALNDANSDLIGLAFVPDGPDRGTTQISANSTALALVMTAPGILGPNLTDSMANADVIQSDPAFAALVDAIRSNSNLSVDNEAVEQAFAAIADRLPATRPPADQGCDSVLDLSAYASAGTCAQPEPNGILIANEQDRWAIIYDGGETFPAACAAISPSTTESAQVLIPSDQCTGDALIVAPGPIPNQGANQALIEERVRVAAAVMQLHDYAGPFAELAGASAGYGDESVLHIRRNAGEIVDALTFVLESEPEFSTAMDANRVATTALDRHNAAVVAARYIIKAADTTALIPNRIPGNDGYVDLLDFFLRAGERMVAPRTDWRWDADAAGMLVFGDDA